MKSVWMLMLIAPMILAQQETDFLFQEDSYITYPIEDNILFEGQIAPNYPVANLKTRSGSAGLAVVITPKMILKMYRTQSNPVKTPSYMPRITFQGFVKGEGFDIYPYVMLSHHSNGQGGPTFLEEYVLDEENLTEVPKLNTESGSFSTNFIRSGYYFSLKSFPKQYVGLSYEHHPVHGWWFSIDPLIKDIYGRKRLIYEYRYLSKLVEVELAHTRIFDKSEDTRDITTGTIKLKMPMFKIPVWLFASYYQGQDYYNIYFQNNVHRFKMGLSVQTSLAINP